MPENTLKLGIIGGALDSAIGRSHHIASQMDGRFRIVAGCSMCLRIDSIANGIPF
jgi:hypothetical protein